MSSFKEKAGKFFDEFKQFAVKGNVMSLAVGVIVGGAFSNLVTSLTENLINPILGLLGTSDGLSGYALNIHIGNFVNATFKWGAFLSDVINFIILAFVVFLLVKFVNSIMDLTKKKEPEKAPETKKCPYCLTEINIKASRCPHCTSELEVEEEVTAELVADVD